MNPFEMTRDDGVGGHNEWLTPPYIIEALGPFDLDPCSPVNPPWITAKTMLNINNDGLSASWGDSYVWLNPPYGKETEKWVSRLREHGNGIALLVARTETRNFHKNVWGHCSAVVFFKGRLKFHHVDGTQASHTLGCPSVLVGYGQVAQAMMHVAVDEGLIDGHYIRFDNGVFPKPR